MSPHREIRPTRLLSPDWFITGVSPNAGPTALEFLKRPGMSIVLTKPKATTGPTPGMVIKRRQVASFRTMDNTLRCRTSKLSRSCCLADSNGSMISAKSTIPSRSSLIRAANASDQANLETEITQQSSDIILNVPNLIQYQLARCESARRCWLDIVLTCTGRNRLTRIICAMPRASSRSVLFTVAFRKALV